MKLTIDNLKECFKYADKNGIKYIGLKIEKIDMNKEEIIINQREDFIEVFRTIELFYDKELKMQGYPGDIRITGFTYGNTFAEIEKDLVRNKYEIKNVVCDYGEMM